MRDPILKEMDSIPEEDAPNTFTHMQQHISMHTQEYIKNVLALPSETFSAEGKIDTRK